LTPVKGRVTQRLDVMTTPSGSMNHTRPVLDRPCTRSRIGAIESMRALEQVAQLVTGSSAGTQLAILELAQQHASSLIAIRVCESGREPDLP
jgi:hypothetical protein